MASEAQGEYNQFQISINGHSFSVSSPHGESHIREVERFVNEQMDSVAKATSAYGPASLAILVALNLADELLTLRKQSVHHNHDWQARLFDFCEQLDQVLVKSSPELVKQM